MCTLAFLELVNEGNVQAQVAAIIMTAIHHCHYCDEPLPLLRLNNCHFAINRCHFCDKSLPFLRYTIFVEQIKGTVMLNDLQGAGPQVD